MHRRTTSRLDRALDVSTEISGLDWAGVVAAGALAGLEVERSGSRRPRTFAASRAAVDDAKVRCGGALCRSRSLRLRRHESILGVARTCWCPSTPRGDSDDAIDDELISTRLPARPPNSLSRSPRGSSHHLCQCS